MIILRYIIPPLLFLTPVWSSVVTDYEECKEIGFGEDELVCDQENLLSNSTKAHLRLLLGVLQEKVSCECLNGCERENGNNRYIGLPLVTTSDKIVASNQTLLQNARFIFENSSLGNEECDNGLLIIYVKDTRQLATYRGSGKLIIWDSTEMAKLHHVASKVRENDHQSIHSLLEDDNYENLVTQTDIQRAGSWPPLLGLLIAIILVLLVLGLLLALLLAKYCCLCARRNKKDLYHVNSTPTYKTIEPLFITTPPLHERILASQSDAIYSTPIPPPHFGPSRLDFYHGSGRSANVSQSATPLSTHKNRIHPIYGPLPRGLTPPDSPSVAAKVDDSTQTNGLSVIEASRQSGSKEVKDPKGYVVSSVRASDGGASTSSASQQLQPQPQPQPQLQPQSQLQVRTTSNVNDHDLSFLDPRRPLEVQTRTDYIY